MQVLRKLLKLILRLRSPFRGLFDETAATMRHLKLSKIVPVALTPVKPLPRGVSDSVVLTPTTSIEEVVVEVEDGAPSLQEAMGKCLTTSEIEIVRIAFMEKEEGKKQKELPDNPYTRHVLRCVDCATRLFNRLYPEKEDQQRSA